MNRFLILFLFCSGTSFAAKAPALPERTFKYYEIGKKDGPMIYLQKSSYQKLPSGNLITKSVVTDPKGAVVFTETIVSNGSTLISQQADVQQTKRHLEMEVKDQWVIFRTRALGPEKGEEPKEDSEKLPQNFISGALAETFVLEHFNSLMAGETVHAKMGIMEIRELVSFKFFKKETTKWKNREVVVIAMKPSSIFISLVLNTIYLYIDLKDQKMIHYVGRTPLWKDVGGKLKALDAEIDLE
jgi:hypothetical protein